jgi:ankyrin repeat protein
MLASAPVATTGSPILDALYHGHADDAQRLANEAGASLNIHEAAAMGAVPRLAQLLAEEPTAVNAWATDGFQPLQLAAFFGRREAAEHLLARGGDVKTASQNSFKVTALHAALAGPAPEIARSFIAAGADVNAVQQDGVTPLHEAAANGRLDLVQLLIERGADIAARDAKGRSAVDFAGEAGHTAIVEALNGSL